MTPRLLLFKLLKINDRPQKQKKRFISSTKAKKRTINLALETMKQKDNEAKGQGNNTFKVLKEKTVHL